MENKEVKENYKEDHLFLYMGTSVKISLESPDKLALEMFKKDFYELLGDFFYINSEDNVIQNRS